eukprot:2727716-Rhodomonas_salina.2
MGPGTSRKTQSGSEACARDRQSVSVQEFAFHRAGESSAGPDRTHVREREARHSVSFQTDLTSEGARGGGVRRAHLRDSDAWACVLGERLRAGVCAITWTLHLAARSTPPVRTRGTLERVERRVGGRTWSFTASKHRCVIDPGSDAAHVSTARRSARREQDRGGATSMDELSTEGEGARGGVADDGTRGRGGRRAAWVVPLGADGRDAGVSGAVNAQVPRLHVVGSVEVERDVGGDEDGVGARRLVGGGGAGCRERDRRLGAAQ